MIRVLFFIEGMSKGGKERRLHELIRALKLEKNFALYLLTFHPTNDFPGLGNLLKEKYWSTGNGSENLLRKIMRCVNSFHKITPDIVHTWGPLNSLIAILLKPFFGFKIVNSQITSAPKNARITLLFHRLPFIFSDVIASNSAAGLQAYNAPKEKSKVIYNGFDFNRIRKILPKNEILSQFTINSELIIGMFSNLTPAKDYQLFFNIAERVLTNREDVTFICAGKGDFSFLSGSLSKAASRRFRVLGPCVEIEQVMSICDIGLQLTNRNGHGEGISNSILELCALGKCVIATNCGGTPEIIDHGVNGFLVGDDIDHITELLSSLLDDKEMRDKIGANAKKVVKEKFSLEKMAGDFISIYKDQLFK